METDKVVPNPFQPRREFNEAKLKELAESIRMYGVLQPLTVTRKEIHRSDGTFYSEYELIAGERRLRASRLGGLSQVPVIIREGQDSEQEKLELAIIENLQREDLNAVDRALAFRQLADTFGLSHSQVAKKVGRSREYVSNTLRLLLLRDYMLDSLKVADISEGHARTLLMLNDRPEEQDTVYREILLKKLSVREVERITRKIAQDKVRSKKWKDTDPELIEMEKQFTETLGTRVQIAKTDFGGKLTIDYFSQDDLEKLLILMRQQETGRAFNSASAAVASELVDTERDTDETLAILQAAGPLQAVPAEDAQSDVADSDVVEEAKDEDVSYSHVMDSVDDHTLDRDASSDENQPSVEEIVPQEAEEQSVKDYPAPSETDSLVDEVSVPVPAQEITSEIVDTPIEDAPVESTNASPEIEAKSDNESQDFVDPATVTKTDEDDSELYTIKNFGV